jgi:hypothetical protein
LEAEIPFAELRQSTYNHTTGRLVLAPAPHAPVSGLNVGPREARQLLAQIYQED